MSDNDTLAVNTIRLLSADMVQAANSGHPGAPMGCAPMAHALFSRHLSFSAQDPSWPARDRFVLSNGHACALLYSLLHLCGYEDVPMAELRNFRQLGSKTPGHPENHITRGVEVSTGPLGQGLTNAVGIAIGQEMARAEFCGEGVADEFAPLMEGSTFVICGDGCLMEGVTAEAASLAGHLGLGNLVVLYDDNQISIDGGTDLAFSEDVLKRFEAYGWHTQTVTDGDSVAGAVASVSDAVAAAKAETARPSIIAVKTTIGFGSAKEGTSKVHGSPLGDEDLGKVKEKFGFNPAESFVVPAEVAKMYAELAAKGEARRASWEALLAKYAQAHPAKAAELNRRRAHQLPANWSETVASLLKDAGVDPASNKDATRKSGGAVLNALSRALPELVGGSADLNPSTLTYLNGSGDFTRTDRTGRNIRFGVREHAMAAVCNGLYAHGLYMPFCSTFLVFSGYAYGAMRVSALAHAHVLYIMTHDSVGLGEDGPTHQPVEVLGLMRSTPGMALMRPADAREVAGCYTVAVSRGMAVAGSAGTNASNVKSPDHNNDAIGPITISLSRQSAPLVEGTSPEGATRGAYTLNPEVADPEIVLAGSGTEVALCRAAAASMAPRKVRVVSVPSMEVFAAQGAAYAAEVFPKGVPVLSVEAGHDASWGKLAHAHVGIATFGMSAPGGQVLKEFGFTAENVAAKAAKLIAHFDGKPAPPTCIEL